VNKILEQYCPPTSLDKHPFATIYKIIVDKDRQEYQFFIQLSQDTEHPKWERLGAFFEQVFNYEFIADSGFMGICLDIFVDLQQKKKESPLIEEN
jgi:hypothetical protein